MNRVMLKRTHICRRPWRVSSLPEKSGRARLSSLLPHAVKAVKPPLLSKPIWKSTLADATAPPGACGLHVVKWPRRAGFHALIRLLLAVLILSGCGNPHIGSSTAPDFSLEALPVGETQGTAANPVKLS